MATIQLRSLAKHLLFLSQMAGLKLAAVLVVFFHQDLPCACFLNQLSILATTHVSIYLNNLPHSNLLYVWKERKSIQPHTVTIRLSPAPLLGMRVHTYAEWDGLAFE